MRITRRLIGIAAICFGSAAAADDGEVCVRGSGDTSIEACTRAIKSGRYDKRNLAIVYSNRGNQWDRMGQFEKAIADHNETKNPNNRVALWPRRGQVEKGRHLRRQRRYRQRQDHQGRHRRRLYEVRSKIDTELRTRRVSALPGAATYWICTKIE